MIEGDDASVLILASGSPRRKELLENCKISFRVVVPEIEEEIKDGEGPQELVERLAQLKANQVADRFPGCMVLGADTVVVLHDRILGKPANHNEALEMLRMLQDQEHSVWGGFALVCRERKLSCVESHETSVRMIALSDELIKNYIDSGEPMDKAGAYAIQGLGGQFISRISGSYSNVVGLNVSAVTIALRRLRSK